MAVSMIALSCLSGAFSTWGLYLVFAWSLDDHATISSYIFSAALMALLIRVNIAVINKYRFERRAFSLGCAPAAVFPHKDPVLGLDAFIEALRALAGHRLLDLYSSRFEKCGTTHYAVVLGSWVLMTKDAENIKAILGPNMDDWPIDGPRLFATLPVLGPDSIFTSNGETWHTARSMLRPSFVRGRFADLESFSRHISNMLAAIPADGTTFDIQDLLLDMAMDVSTDLILGCSTGLLTQASPEARQFAADFEYASRESAKMARLGPVLYKLPHPRLRAAVRGLRAYVRFYVRRATDATKKASGGARDGYPVFLDELVAANASEDYITDQVLSVLIAGRDTTATAMAAVFYFLSRAPDAVGKLRREILDAGEDEPTWEQLKQMKYLNNVIRETLRLFSPIGTNSRTSKRETVLPRGGGKDGNQPILVPKGMSVRWSSHALHRDKAVYGSDADEFRPERWESGLRVSWEYIPFSGGPRICLGQQFALTQIAYTVFTFFKAFRAIEARDSGPLLIQTNLTGSFPYGCLISATRV